MNPLLRSVLFALEPERAHRLSILALKSGLGSMFSGQSSSRLATEVAGLRFQNPIGIAAGYDKNGEVAGQLIALGFGFAEIGTVTPLPQPGNPPPRLFRLTRERAVINRLGFNNDGHAACRARLQAAHDDKLVIGVNVGANKTSTDRIADYLTGIETFAPLASYLTINISSPNTPGLRDLQSREHLAELLDRSISTRDNAVRETAKAVPLFLKIAPDLTEQALDDIAEEVERSDVDGLIVSNTTIDRPDLVDRNLAEQAGGLSGVPLFEKSTIVLAKMRRRCGPKRAIIGVGGIDSASTALEKVRAGADLVQLYTGFVYGGPSLPGRIVADMVRHVDAEGLDRLSDIRDSHLDDWADKQL